MTDLVDKKEALKIKLAELKLMLDPHKWDVMDLSNDAFNDLADLLTIINDLEEKL